MFMFHLFTSNNETAAWQSFGTKTEAVSRRLVQTVVNEIPVCLLCSGELCMQKHTTDTMFVVTVCVLKYTTDTVVATSDPDSYRVSIQKQMLYSKLRLFLDVQL